MPTALADGVLAVVKAATTPIFDEIKALRAEVATLREKVAAGPVHGEPGPAGAQGAPGAPGVAGDRGERGEKGEAGAAGRDGLAGVQGPAGLNGKDGVNGLDGKDGLGFDDLAVDYDGERTFTLTFSQGDRVKAFPFSVPFVLYRGVYQAGKDYAAGDSVTWAGHLYIAEKATSAKPGESGEASRAWRMAVRRGSEGKDGPAGPQGPQGPRGEQGPQGRAGY